MPAPRATRAARAHVRRARVDRRGRRIALLVVLAVLAVPTALLTAFGSGEPRIAQTAGPAPAQRLLPARPPQPEVIALQGSLRLDLPIPQERLTALGYHAASEDALPLQPLGRQANVGLLTRLTRRFFGGGGGSLRWYQLDGSDSSGRTVLDVGAPSGTDVYAPVDGTVVGISREIVNGRAHGVRLDIQPASAPSIVVSLTHLRPDPGLNVGSAVAATSSRVGTVLDFSGVERQALARYTQDAGNHVSLEVHPAATLSVP